MGHGRIRAYVLAALAFAVLVVWAFWPSGGPQGPPISERAKHRPAYAGVVSSQVIADNDLPPEGTRSLFDHLLAQNDGLPYPFEKLLELIQRQHPEGKPPVTLMIPLGRSLLKAQADFEHPRVLVAADFQAPDTDTALGLAPRGQLFLGFVENANEIEVLSYNEAAGRFEFQLVQNYCAGCVPRIVYARRAICTTCHQGAAPIFPQRPWSETNGQPEIAQKIIEARGDAPYLGLPPVNPLAAPERFDELTDVGNFMPATQRMWLDGCSEGVAGAQCRKQMLQLALRYLWNPGDFDARGADAAKLRALQAVTWPKDGIAVAESDIPNRDPLAERRGLRGFIRTLFAPQRPGSGAKDNADLEAFDRLPKLPAALDPLSPRTPKRVLGANDLDGAFGLAQFFTAADVKLLEQAADYEWPRLQAAVDQMNPTLFAPQPFSRVKTVNALLGVLGRKTALSYCCLDTAEMSPPVAAGVPPLALSANSPLQSYERYCFACHRGNPAKRLNFMAGASEDEVLANIKGKSEIRDALDWERYRGTDKDSTLMPPADSLQRRALEQALAGDPQLLEEMRKVVPGLFDF